jgi:hypothetical protein
MASAVHLAFYELELGDHAFCLAVRPRQRDRRTNGRLFFGDAIAKRAPSRHDDVLGAWCCSTVMVTKMVH